VRIASLGEGFPRRFPQNNWKRKTYFLERAVMDDCGAMDASAALCAADGAPALSRFLATRFSLLVPVAV
jgi:hypothetical protein